MNRQGSSWPGSRRSGFDRVARSAAEPGGIVSPLGPFASLIPPPKPASGSPCGFTLVELIVALGISTVLVTVVYQLLWQGRMVGTRVAAGSSASQEARLKIRRMTNEIQEGTRLFHTKEGQTAGGVGFVNARGETIFYYVDGAQGGPQNLYRANLNAPSEPPELLAKNLRHFRATSAVCGRGRAQSRVNVDISVGSEAGQGEANVVTSIFLRGVERYIPEDPTHGSWGVPGPDDPGAGS
ncbi:MAG: prepilin-type N-terminal cleavage/methylation domain-containing protein [Candidatus Riflebacteria bacterium]|nr:prepilin-type N-terminal cleavage/methylation domain-containing protein [Candidatus Riflebacteria bacterium]